MDKCCVCGKTIPTLDHFDCHNCGEHVCRECVSLHNCDALHYAATLEPCPEGLALVDSGDLCYQYRVDCAGCGDVEWSDDFSTSYEQEVKAAKDSGWHEVRREYPDGQSKGAWVCPACWQKTNEKGA